jgi:hypothetical protein
MRPTATAVAQSFSARIQVKTYPFSSILALKLAFFRSVKSGSPSAVNNPFLSFAIRDKKPQDRVAP